MPLLSNIRRLSLEATCGHRVVFHHVPKCGGTSIERALRLRYALSYDTFALNHMYSAIEALNPNCSLAEADDYTAHFREIQLLSLLFKDVRCIAGHVYFSEVAHDLFKDRYHFVTTLREPVAFFRSFYGQLVTAKEPRWQFHEGFEAFLECDLAPLVGRFYLLYFAPPETRDALVTGEDIERAKRNLAKCRIVGFVEDLPDFERRLRDLLGVRLKIGHANKSKISNNSEQVILTPAIRRKIEDLSAVNFELYEFARQELRR